MKKQIETGEGFVRILQEYAPRDSLFRRDEDEMHDLKHAVFDALTDAERNTLITYAELQSYTQTANLLGVGRTTIRDELARIRKKIIEYMKGKGYDY